MVDILHRVGMKSSVDQVYKALATRAGLAAWWTEDTQGESKVGGVLQFRFNVGGVDVGGFDMKVLALDPGKRVLWQVLEGAIDKEFKALADPTRRRLLDQLHSDYIAATPEKVWHLR